VVCNFGKGRSQTGILAETPFNEPSTGLRDGLLESNLILQDFAVVVMGDVPADHVEEKHPERPDRRRAPVVVLLLDPLRRSANTGAQEFHVALALVKGTGAEVHQFGGACEQVNHYVFILYVAMKHTDLGTGTDRVQNLFEEVSRHGFVKGACFRDEIEEVLGRGGAFHDDDETVRELEPVQHLDYARDVCAVVEEGDFQGRQDALECTIARYLGSFDPFDCHRQAILQPEPGIDSAETALSKSRSDSV
jgi:hypothetical protein